MRLWSAACIAAALAVSSCGRSTSSYIERGNQLFQAGKYDDASISYRNALKKDPKSGEANYRLGLVLLKQNNPGEAYQALTRAVEFSPQNQPAKVELADLCLAAFVRNPSRQTSLYNRANALKDQLLAANASSPDGLRLKAEIALLDRHPEDAIATFRRALQASSGSARIQTELAEALMQNNQAAEGESQAKEVVAHHPDYGAAYDLLYSRYIPQQRWADAESLLKLRMSNNPKDPAPILLLATFYASRQKPDDAEKTANLLLSRRDVFPQADLLVGDFHTLTRSYDKALADFQRGLSRDQPREKTYQERSATLLAVLGRRDEALKTIDTILAKDPKDTLVRILKVTILLDKGGAENINAAAAIGADMVKEAPSNPSILMLAGRAALAKGDLDIASTHFQQAAKFDQRSTAARLALARVYMLRRNYPGVLEQSNAALAIDRKNETARLYRIIGLTATSSYTEAKKEAEQLAHDSPNSRQAQMQLGIIALSQKQYAQAESYFQKLYRDKDSDLQPLAALVRTYFAENASDRALQFLEAENKRKPGSLEKESLMAATAEASGKLDLALSELQGMAAQAPNSAEVQLRIAEVERRKGNLAAALEALERARKIDPNRRGIDASIASAQQEMGKNAEAVANYRKALAKMPDDPVISNNLAYLLAETNGDLNEALRLITGALRKAPTNPSLQDTLAWVDLRKGNTAAALPIFSSITSKNPNDITFRYHYATALLRNGDRTGARRELEAALSKKPPQPMENEIRSLLAKAQ